MKIALGQMAVTSADPEGNFQKAVEMVQEAKKQQADIVVLPQLAISGAQPGDNWLDIGFIDDCLYWGDKLAEKSQGIGIIFGNISYENGRLRQACYWAHDGLLQCLPSFVAPASFPSGDQFFTSEQAKNGQTASIRVGGNVYRVAFLLGDWQKRELPITANYVDMIFNLAQTPLDLQESFDHRAVVKKYGCHYIFVNSCTLVSSGKTYWLCPGGSALYDTKGYQILGTPLFTVGCYSEPQIAPVLPQGELIYKACVCAVKNFMDSIGASKAVIGLSGGIDSALAACFYTEALGGDNVLLINMPSRYNSDITKNLSGELAKALKTHYAIMPIEESWQATLRQFNETIISAPDGENWKLTISPAVGENIQARDRSARILAAAAAAWNAIFTCNSNKAELTVGYATFYGDLAGAFAVMADLWKHEVYEAASFAQKVFPKAADYLGSIASLRPSAELSTNQAVEEGKGDPLLYPYHDYLLRAFVEKKINPADILAWYSDGSLEENIGCQKGIVSEYFAGSDRFVADLVYWWKMYRRTGTAKRLQGPPLLALSAYPFGDGKGEVQAAPYLSRRFWQLKEQLEQEG